MFQLVYVSTAIDQLNKNEIMELLESSQAKNQSLDITGLLIFLNGKFLQVLEGDRDAVEGLCEQIRNDERHYGFIRLMAREIDERQFADWSMAFRDLDEEGLEGVDGIRELLHEPDGALVEEGDERLKGLLSMFEDSLNR